MMIEFSFTSFVFWNLLHILISVNPLSSYYAVEFLPAPYGIGLQLLLFEHLRLSSWCPVRAIAGCFDRRTCASPKSRLESGSWSVSWISSLYPANTSSAYLVSVAGLSACSPSSARNCSASPSLGGSRSGVLLMSRSSIVVTGVQPLTERLLDDFSFQDQMDLLYEVTQNLTF